jgi:hypothetical protein
LTATLIPALTGQSVGSAYQVSQVLQLRHRNEKIPPNQ